MFYKSINIKNRFLLSSKEGEVKIQFLNEFRETFRNDSTYSDP